jgi:predicted phosphodiesterase
VRTLFVGDVHGCSVELEKLIEKAEPTRIILLGDIFTKGPHPRKVWKLIKKFNIEAILGNHDVLTLKKNRPLLPPKATSRLTHLPLFLRGDSWIAVHGGRNPRGPTCMHDAIHLRRWPNEEKTNPFWWQLYHGDKLVIYGHDAKRKIQDNRPYTLGLDSGCVYGSSLTGFLLEEERLYQIPASASYCPF